MAAPTTASGRKVALYLNTTGSTWVLICGLKEKSFTLAANAAEDTIYDCSDTDAVPFVTREMVSKSAEASGSGTAAINHLDELRAAFEANAAMNWRYEIPGAGADGGGYWQGAFIITSLKIGASIGQKADIDISLQSAGAVAWTSAA